MGCRAIELLLAETSATGAAEPRVHKLVMRLRARDSVAAPSVISSPA
ncbi:hypothetical protein AB0M54_19570 [Actinoplanes sp. NPDC051470]